jgi:hypothetical protein
VFQLTELPSGRGHGVLMPHLSRDGRLLSWSQMKAPPSSARFTRTADVLVLDAPDGPHYRGKVWATDASWSPDGRSFVGYVQTSLLKRARS